MEDKVRNNHIYVTGEYGSSSTGNCPAAETLSCATLMLQPCHPRQPTETASTQAGLRSNRTRKLAHNSYYNAVIIKLRLFKIPVYMCPKVPNFFLQNSYTQLSVSKHLPYNSKMHLQNLLPRTPLLLSLRG